MPVIRRATRGDEDVVVALVREFYAVDRHPFVEARVLAGLRPLLEDDTHGQIWLVVDDTGRAESANRSGVACGYAVLTWGWSLESGGRECLLDEIYVRDPGRGLGRILLDEVLGAATFAGASVMFLETEAHNERARAFYARAGFETEDSVWMCRDLERGAG